MLMGARADWAGRVAVRETGLKVVAQGEDEAKKGEPGASGEVVAK